MSSRTVRGVTPEKLCLKKTKKEKKRGKKKEAGVWGDNSVREFLVRHRNMSLIPKAHMQKPRMVAACVYSPKTWEVETIVPQSALTGQLGLRS